MIYIYDIIKHCSILDWYDIHLMLKLYIYPSCGKENLLVKCVFSIGNPTLFHVSLATSVYQGARWLCFQTFNAKARILLSLENVFKSYTFKSTNSWLNGGQKLFKDYLKAIQKVFKSLIYRCFQKVF